MSGHSKWSTIKRKKEATDNARGRVFSKLSRAITIAVKTGGGNNPDTNYKLKMAIEAARAENMPKANIERALSKGDSSGDISELTYEGFAPGGAGILVEVATDNRNRSAQEIKQIFDRAGGQIAGPGAISFNFDSKGLLIVKKQQNVEEQILQIIESGAEDVEEDSHAIEVTTAPTEANAVRESIEKMGYTVTSMNIVQKPKLLHQMSGESEAKKILQLLSSLDDNDDVQNVYTNADIPDELVSKLE